MWTGEAVRRCQQNRLLIVYPTERKNLFCGLDPVSATDTLWISNNVIFSLNNLNTFLALIPKISWITEKKQDNLFQIPFNFFHKGIAVLWCSCYRWSAGQQQQDHNPRMWIHKTLGRQVRKLSQIPVHLKRMEAHSYTWILIKYYNNKSHCHQQFAAGEMYTHTMVLFIVHLDKEIRQPSDSRMEE